MLRYLLPIAVFISLLGCSSKNEKELDLEAVDLVKFEASVKLNRIWSRKAGSGQDNRYTRFSVALDGQGNIYTAGYKGDVQSFEANTGKKGWSINTDEPISGGVGVDTNTVYFGTYNGTVHALDSRSGEQLWQVEISSEVLSAPVSNGDLVVATTIDGRVFALDTKTGEQRWSYDHALPVLTVRGTASAVVTASQVIVAFDNGQVLSLSASDGSTQWEFRVARPQGRTELDRIVDIDGTPIIDGGYLYAGSFQGNVAAVSRGSGRVMWTKAASTSYSMAAAQGKVFVSTEDSRIQAFNAITGELEWENFELKRRNTSGPVVFDSFLAVTDGYGYVHVLNQSDGKFAARFKMPGGKQRSRGMPRIPLLSDGEILYTYADGGKLSAYTVKTEE
ncbi:outer membrane protein assembly factor BamB [Teredinibacter franksiae]|uniref:outer membrane protein assembly factor BamB n=1 Tax=Teredinibacter franksiae TaxID=2761453 RepID=UPI0016250D9F|nr:outer membrane protein assembly factor BamB [Teredinibacter franksiae]